VKVLYLSLSTARQPQVVRDATYVAERGGEVVIITTKPQAWPTLHDAISIIGLAEAESRHWLLRGERVAVFRLPAMALRLVRKLLVMLQKVLPGPAGAARKKVEALMVWQLKGATRFHKERFAKFYRPLRPFVLWRVAKAEALSKLDVASFDHIVVADSLSTSVGWQLADAYPEMDVGFDLVRDRG
jgi:hypothetical protein